YALIIGLLILSVDAPWFSSHFLDDIAFRAAWITLAQVPLAYFLATKRGPLNFLAALSYERINWIHKWVGRIMFLSATTHMSTMMYSISVSDIIRSPDKVMIIVRYGVGAYTMLAWIVLTSILPLRRWSYRLFYINHLVSTFALLWILFQHVPKYARGPIYMAVGFVFFDKFLTIYYFVRHNTATISRKKGQSKSRARRKSLTIGHSIKMTTPPPFLLSSLSLDGAVSLQIGSTTVIRICNVPFSWRPGQHVRLYLPRLGLLELHPFTPATCSSSSTSGDFPEAKDPDVEQDRLLHRSRKSSEDDMILIVRTHSGLTRRLESYYSQWLASPCPNATKPPSCITSFIDGPYGVAPQWEEYENLILIATSTGVSFTLSIMDYLARMSLDTPKHLHSLTIRFIWILRHLEPQLDAAVSDMVLKHFSYLQGSGVNVDLKFFATCPESGGLDGDSRTQEFDPFAYLRQPHGTFAGRCLPALGNQGEPRNLTLSSLDCDGSSTLIDESEEISPPELEAPQAQSTGLSWSRPSAYVAERSPTNSQKDKCACRLIRNCLHATEYPPSSQDVSRSYGVRPDISSLLMSSSLDTDTSKAMVGICSNPELSKEAKNAVARINLAYARGKRRRGMDIFTEAF
ncbi:uncharacterized protein BDR25DRAFT_190854, partial [Lindgomyces ingoldianus]